MVAQLRDRKQHLEQELELIKVALEALEKAWSIDACLATDDAVVNKLTSDAQRFAQVAHDAQSVPEFAGLSYGDAAERLLSRISDRRPLGTRTIIRRLDLGGKKVKGQDPYRTLYRTLLKDARFVRIEGKWALADWYPARLAPGPNNGEKAAAKDAEERKRVN
jgi:hypothetical protein